MDLQKGDQRHFQKELKNNNIQYLVRTHGAQLALVPLVLS